MNLQQKIAAKKASFTKSVEGSDRGGNTTERKELGQNNEGDQVDNSGTTPLGSSTMDVVDYDSVRARIAEILAILAGPETLSVEHADSLKEEQAQLIMILEAEPVDPAPIVDPATQAEDSEDALETQLAELPFTDEEVIGKALNLFEPAGLGTNSIPSSDVVVNSVPNKVVDYNPPSEDGTLEVGAVDYTKEVTITVGDLLDMHRITGYCLRGNQRPAVLRLQQMIANLLPEGTPIIHREP